MFQVLPETKLFYDRKRKIAVYRTISASDILCNVSTARAIDDHHVAVPCDLYSLQLLAHLGLPVPPIMDDYDWPHVREALPQDAQEVPAPHQRITANFTVLHPKCFNLSDMGTMKTLSTLWAADYLMEQHDGEDFRCLVIAPLSTLQTVWGDAIFCHFMGRRSYRILDGTADQRLRLLNEPADFYIINFDGTKIGAKRGRLTGLSAALAQRKDIKLVVVDESSAYKDPRTGRHRVARKIFEGRPYIWLLTGTPTAQSHLGAFGQAKLVNNANGESYHSWVQRTTVPVSRFKRVPTRDAHLEARKLLTPAIRYDIKDVWNGPPLTIQQRQVALTDIQRQKIKELKTQLAVQLENGQLVVPANEAVARAKFLQIVLGAIYDHEHNWHAINSAPRVHELESIIDQTDGKIIIFAPLTSLVALLYKRLASWTREVVTGNTSSAERARIFAAFQGDEAPRLLIADPVCLHLGVGLWKARATVWYGPTDRTEVYLQANKRMHRPGQRYPSTIVQLVATPLEREIYKRLADNQTLQGSLLDMVRKGELL